MVPRLLAGALAVSLAACSPFVYEGPEADAELRGALAAAHAVRTDGPAWVRIAERMEIRVGAGSVFIPAAAAGRLLRAIGERPVKDVLGLVIAGAAGGTEVAVLYAAGERIPGIPELEVAGWRAAPALAGLGQR